MTATDELCDRLSAASEQRHWLPWTSLVWPENLGDGWVMSPELLSLYGTPDWDSLDDGQRRRLSLCEHVNLVSAVLHGERVLCEGVPRQLYTRRSPSATRYLHHFLEEENRHMMVFGAYCQRYFGKVYTNKKLALTPASLSEEELDLRFHVTALVVEEIGVRYDAALAADERLPAVVRDIHRLHHADESRHLAYGRRQLTDLWASCRPGWTDEAVSAFQRWVRAYLGVAWREHYNVDVYRDTGLADPHEVQRRALGSPVTRAHRERLSSSLVTFLHALGVLDDATVA